MLPNRFSPFRRASAAGLTTLAVLAGLFVTALPAAADTAPTAGGEPATVSSDLLPTAQIDGVVWAQTVVADTVYAGGHFATARPSGAAPGVNTVPRSNLLAYSISTGVLNPAFHPVVNGEVLAVAASPDGKRLYIAGQFTKVDGQVRNRLAAFDLTTGALVPGFQPAVNAGVRALAVTNSLVYFGGDFSAIAGANRNRLAVATASTGAITPWSPNAQGGSPGALALSTDGTKVAIGGHFTSLNGKSDPGYGLGMVPSTGSAHTALPVAANSTVRDGGLTGAITSLTTDGNSVYATGYDYGSTSNFEGTIRIGWDGGKIEWMDDCLGDSYGVFVTPTVVYKSSHAHDCSTVPGGFPEVKPRDNHQALAYTKAAEGSVTRSLSHPTAFAGNPAPTLLDWYPSFLIGTYTKQYQATWNVTGNSQYVVFGGEFIGVNNKPQQGLIRFALSSIAPNKDGPRLSAAGLLPTVTASAPDSLSLAWPANWDRDNRKLTYRLFRDGNTSDPVATMTSLSTWFARPTLTYVDRAVVSGKTYSYTLTVTDPFGNVAKGGTITATAVAAPAPLAADAFSRNAAGSWGTAPSGGAWKGSGPAANYAVNVSAAALTLIHAGDAFSGVLPAVSSISSDVRVTTTLKQAVSGAPATVSVLPRVVGAADYRATLTFSNVGGKVTLSLLQGAHTVATMPVAGLTYSAGTALAVRVQAFGTTPTVLRAKVWRATTSEPTAWQLSGTDSAAALQFPGGVGVAASMAKGSSAPARVMTFDNLGVTEAR